MAGKAMAATFVDILLRMAEVLRMPESVSRFEVDRDGPTVDFSRARTTEVVDILLASRLRTVGSKDLDCYFVRFKGLGKPFLLAGVDILSKSVSSVFRNDLISNYKSIKAFSKLFKAKKLN